jgi:hypothetical protein
MVCAAFRGCMMVCAACYRRTMTHTACRNLSVVPSGCCCHTTIPVAFCGRTLASASDAVDGCRMARAKKHFYHHHHLISVAEDAGGVDGVGRAFEHLFLRSAI